ncbi:N-acetylglucosamine kinase-like BadF-type ATPase [Symbiobacterium terraclitae]|uniref:N-acetylglucosamine kinase-like BadF-type ATPase n=1 Tax=Symbiobacterium terraclitae TaxID=557451 RepID=A0ABS4JPP8_9FIRM|nr:BadF/BadG/BcrA/BcrD ATPase family protein [Symbiobacterium terraclitae]MBP2017517.1 N-acetylglucosamine kinase-like BadF-type ATPase [Symbiobacterium terraclitae]
MAERLVVLGIDGGGTRTRCLAADLSGNILGEGAGGPANALVVGQERAVVSVAEAVRHALQAAGRTPDDVGAVCAGLAGAGQPETQEALAGALAAALALPAAARIQVVTDARIALAGALQGKPGAILIAGTGSIAYGLDDRGRLHRAGGWGWILGDEGSGFTIGRQALAAGLAALDGTGPATVLGDRICAAWNLQQLSQAVPRVYADPAAARTEIAALVPVVVQAAGEGDAVSREILAQAGRDLAQLAAALLRRLALPEPVVATTGGVLESVAAVREALIRRLAELAPAARVVASAASPASGAVLMARMMLG